MNDRLSDPIDKRTLILRLSVNIYKMSNEKLGRLLTIFSQGDSLEDSASLLDPKPIDTEHGGNIKRQMMIARLFVLLQQMNSEQLLERLHAFNDQDYKWARDYPRMDCNLLVDFSVDGKAYRGYLRDISAGGIFIVTSEKFEIDQDVLLCFSLYESNENLPFKIYGRIKRIFADGIGVQYHDITDYQQRTLDVLVQKKINP